MDTKNLFYTASIAIATEQVTRSYSTTADYRWSINNSTAAVSFIIYCFRSTTAYTFCLMFRQESYQDSNRKCYSNRNHFQVKNQKL